MKTITVNASRQYDVIIGSGLLGTLGDRLHAITKAKKICIVSDTNVFPIYGDESVNILTSAGFDVVTFVFPAGEENKNGAVYLELLNFLANHQLTRTDCIVALGGGVVGDLAGFAAATYLRGIDFVQIPTTLLAAVDSSVGGKTAIDLTAGKNLCGAFYQPKLVLCDIDTLKSLPDETFRDGCAEVIKYGILFDRELFLQLTEQGLGFDRVSVIGRCVELKRDVVNQDEFESGLRMKLNLGHTIGHAVEKCSGYAISHGSAVAIGTAIVSRGAVKSGLCDSQTLDDILYTLLSFGLPITTAYDAEMLFCNALSDKKRSGGSINLIIPRSIGCCDIVPTAVTDLKSFIQAGL